MAIRVLAVLKGYFMTGRKPTEGDYHDMLDSLVHKNDLQAANEQAVQEAITAYDTSQKTINNNGIIENIGEVLQYLTGLADTARLKATLDLLTSRATWGGLPGKPSSVPLAWNDQVIDTSTATLNPRPGAPNSTPVNPVQRWLVSEFIGITGPIVDIKVERYWYETGQFYVEHIVLVKVAVQTKVNL
ncbi:hypothetical protein DYU11_18545 [Fibrisoma montanum]|uniref:Uncharacterized protein n=1 Tax=Fibrisoma montanum TaxID=2305895 RepID=A0A418M6I7_9BACT|nr:hypothetical protein [Fibrisoma montanum]RIV21406.1 hypothetical protein DYU11_18545 [Fibrisoma montanum]